MGRRSCASAPFCPVEVPPAKMRTDNSRPSLFSKKVDVVGDTPPIPLPNMDALQAFLGEEGPIQLHVSAN